MQSVAIWTSQMKLIYTKTEILSINESWLLNNSENNGLHRIFKYGYSFYLLTLLIVFVFLHFDYWVWVKKNKEPIDFWEIDHFKSVSLERTQRTPKGSKTDKEIIACPVHTDKPSWSIQYSVIACEDEFTLISIACRLKRDMVGHLVLIYIDVWWSTSV